MTVHRFQAVTADARERPVRIGIPAVANIPGILNALRDGESITVDGSRGCVVRSARGGKAQ
jgi:phosphohistidine swiveling domain-containing protein